MSSHHIVRDEQEPALILADPLALSWESVGTLLEWSPTVVVLQPALDEVLSWGIKVDAVVGWEPSVEELKEQLAPQSPVKLLLVPEGQPLLGTALYFLHQQRYPAANLLLDVHTQGEPNPMVTLQEMTGVMDLVVFSQGYKCWPLRGGVFEKWMPEGQALEVVPMVEGVMLTTQGLWPVCDNERLEQPLGFRVEESGRITIKSNGKPAWVYEKIEAIL